MGKGRIVERASGNLELGSSTYENLSSTRGELSYQEAAS